MKTSGKGATLTGELLSHTEGNTELVLVARRSPATWLYCGQWTLTIIKQPPLGLHRAASIWAPQAAAAKDLSGRRVQQHKERRQEWAPTLRTELSVSRTGRWPPCYAWGNPDFLTNATLKALQEEACI